LGAHVGGKNHSTSKGWLTCRSWTVSSNNNTHVWYVDYNGTASWIDQYDRHVAARPALPPSEASKITPSAERVINGIHIVEYGEYPQTVADKYTSDKLERLLKSKSLRPTGKSYTFDKLYCSCDYTYFNLESHHPEYELDGKKYIRVLGPPYADSICLSSGEQIEINKPYWVEVQPIEWLADESGTLVSKKCLFAGIQYDKRDYNGDFSKTFMKDYLNNYFAKEMGHEEIISRQEHDKVLMGLSARLEAMTNAETIDAIKERLRTAERGRKTPTDPKRMEEAARIKQVRQARDIILTTLQEAAESNDNKLVQKIMNLDIVRYYDSRHQIQQEKVQQRRAIRHAQRKQGDR